MSEWIGVLSSIPGWISFLLHITERMKPKPSLEALDHVITRQSSIEEPRWSLSLKVRNKGNGWARVQRIRWNIFKQGSKEVLDVGELDTSVSPEVIAPRGSEKEVYMGNSSNLNAETEYLIKISFEIEENESWLYEGLFSTPELIPHSPTDNLSSTGAAIRRRKQ